MEDSGHTWFSKVDFGKAVKDLEASRAKVKELETLCEKYELLLREIHKACLCERSIPGFDYHETHRRLGDPGGRWLTQRDATLLKAESDFSGSMRTRKSPAIVEEKLKTLEVKS
jgi:predicted metal-dependent hydrolase